MELYLAPLQGLTEFYYRNAFSTEYHGIDKAMTPFISILSCKTIEDYRLRDILPENNMFKPLIPQVLGNNPQDFLLLVKAIEDLGYTEINWNLGCPAKDIRRKKRGSGLLPYPDLIEETLAYILPRINARLSIKLRLGKESTREIFPVIKVLNRYPLSEIIIHPRIAIQFYKGDLWLDELDEVMPLLKHRFIFNGDVNSPEFFRKIVERYPKAQGVMIGRGLLMNPALAEEIKSDNILKQHEKQIRFFRFYDHLIEELRKHYSSDQNMLNKLKEYWSYFSKNFPENENLFHTLKKIQDAKEFFTTIEDTRFRINGEK